VDEEFARGRDAEVFGVGVAYAGYWDGELGWGWFVGAAAEGEEEGVEGDQEGVEEEVVEGGCWGEG